MKQNIHQMEAPGRKAEEGVAQHEADMHEGPVVVGADSLKRPDIGGKYLRDEPHLPDPEVLLHLGDVIIDKPVAEGVPIDSARHCNDDQN